MTKVFFPKRLHNRFKRLNKMLTINPISYDHFSHSDVDKTNSVEFEAYKTSSIDPMNVVRGLNVINEGI